ncbi:hypothetical protein COBT_002791, partial [Conglomerata obtusa]
MIFKTIALLLNLNTNQGSVLLSQNNNVFTKENGTMYNIYDSILLKKETYDNARILTDAKRVDKVITKRFRNKKSNVETFQENRLGDYSNLKKLYKVRTKRNQVSEESGNPVENSNNDSDTQESAITYEQILNMANDLLYDFSEHPNDHAQETESSELLVESNKNHTEKVKRIKIFINFLENYLKHIAINNISNPNDLNKDTHNDSKPNMKKTIVNIETDSIAAKTFGISESTTSKKNINKSRTNEQKEIINKPAEVQMEKQIFTKIGDIYSKIKCTNIIRNCLKEQSCNITQEYVDELLKLFFVDFSLFPTNLKILMFKFIITQITHCENPESIDDSTNTIYNEIYKTPIFIGGFYDILNVSNEFKSLDFATVIDNFCNVDKILEYDEMSIKFCDEWEYQKLLYNL